jgi:hypothetical protein
MESGQITLAEHGTKLNRRCDRTISWARFVVRAAHVAARGSVTDPEIHQGPRADDRWRDDRKETRSH